MMAHNPEFQPVQTAFQFMKTPMVQEMVVSVMCDIGVISAILRNDAVQTFLRSLMLGNSTMRLTNGAHYVISTPEVQGSHSEEHSLVSMILSWLLDNMEIGFMGIFNTLRSIMKSTLESNQNQNTTTSWFRVTFIFLSG